MAKETTVTLKGASGRSYDIDVYPWGTSFKAVGAVYIILKKSDTNFSVLYIGQTGDLSERFDNHHKRPCFDRHSKTHIGIHPVSSKSHRFDIETDLVRNYSPVCND